MTPHYTVLCSVHCRWHHVSSWCCKTPADLSLGGRFEAGAVQCNDWTVLTGMTNLILYHCIWMKEKALLLLLSKHENKKKSLKVIIQVYYMAMLDYRFSDNCWYWIKIIPCYTFLSSPSQYKQKKYILTVNFSKINDFP